MQWETNTSRQLEAKIALNKTILNARSVRSLMHKLSHQGARRTNICQRVQVDRRFMHRIAGS